MISVKARQRRKSPIGVDLGRAGVRAVQLTRTGEECLVSASVQSERSAGGVDGEEDAGRVAHRVAECVSKALFSGRTAAVALSSPDLEFHALDLPAAVFKTGAAGCTQVVRSEIERLMSDLGDGAETRHWLLPDPPSGAPAANAIGVGVRREVVTGAISACDSAGLDCVRVDAAATALCRFGALLRADAPECAWGVLDLGERQARLVLCIDDTPVLVRPIGPGSHTWTRRIADKLDLSAKAAEVHKREHGIAAVGRGAGRDQNDAVRTELPAILLGALRRDLNELAGEIKRSYEYVLRCYPDRKAGDLILTGRGSLLRNLPEFLGNALGIPVRRASTYLEGGGCRLTYRSGHNDPLEAFAVAVGLVLEQ